MTNKLSDQSSSYLKAASKQLIDWHPWSEEVFEKAGREGKPVLLSIGAVWCHWCHVQAHESWENKEIAEIVNKNFVAVKVDRDERPDLDSAYQKFVQMFTGAGGWPLTVFITSEKKPFFGGTYFRPEDLKAILKGIAETYSGEKERIDKMTEDVASLSEMKVDRIDLDSKSVERGVAVILNDADSFNGGFGGRPKFPMSEALLLLLDYYNNTGREEVKKFLDLTLRKMADGGVYDQLGGGFHRYSVDEQWRVPHFEKMLTDNALLLKVYLKAYQITGDEFYRKISEEIISFLERDMLGENGLFYSSQDADSPVDVWEDGKNGRVSTEEGAYFTWTKKEVMEILGEKEARVMCAYYGIKEKGNFEVGNQNVLHKEAEIQDIVEEMGLKKEDAERIIESSKKILFKIRCKRPASFIDKNSFTNWDCLASSAFLDAYNILGEKKYLDTALKNLDFVLDNLYKNGILYHMFSGGVASVMGFMDDYVFFGKTLIEAYQITFEEKYLNKAEEIVKKTIEKFWDKKDFGFFYSEDRYLSTEKPIFDFSSPAGNSVAARVLLDLFYLTEKSEYKEIAEKILKFFHELSPRGSLQKGTYLQALDYYFAGPKEFVIIGDKKDILVKEFVETIGKKTGNKIIHVGETNSAKSVFKDRTKIDGKPTVYMCYKNTCSMPVTEKEKLDLL